jgi:short subunit dehydrogenase-like uncharacterized protein
MPQSLQWDDRATVIIALISWAGCCLFLFAIPRLSHAEIRALVRRRGGRLPATFSLRLHCAESVPALTFDGPMVVAINRNRIGRRESVLKSFVKRFFVAPALSLAAILMMRLLFRFGNHSISPNPRANYTLVLSENSIRPGFASGGRIIT